MATLPLELTLGRELATAFDRPIPSLKLTDPSTLNFLSSWCPPCDPLLFHVPVTPTNAFEIVLSERFRRSKRCEDRPGVGLFRSHFDLGFSLGPREQPSTDGAYGSNFQVGFLGEVSEKMQRLIGVGKTREEGLTRVQATRPAVLQEAEKREDELARVPVWLEDLEWDRGSNIARQLMKTLVSCQKKLAHRKLCCDRWNYWVLSQTNDQSTMEVSISRTPRPVTERELKAAAHNFALKQQTAAAGWRDSYHGERSTRVHPSILVRSTPSPNIPSSYIWPIHRKFLPPSVRYFTNGSPAVKGPQLHRAIFLGEFAECLSFILQAFRIRKDIRPSLRALTKDMSCREVKAFIADETQFPMAYALRQDIGESKLWDKTMRRRFRQFNAVQPSKPKRSCISLCFSILMVKKYFGDLCDCDFTHAVAGHKARLTKTPPTVSQAAYESLTRAVDELVKPEWFDKYSHFCENIALPNRSYLNLPRSSGGLHDAIVEEDCEIVNGRTQAHTEFIKTLTESPSGKWEEIVQSYLASESAVEARYVGGPLKNRGVTINHPAHFLLKGVQMCLHKGLKRDQRFRFIGEPIRDVGLGMDSERSWLVSGDYEAATDNFPPEVTRHVWNEIKKKIGNRVPDHVLEIGDHSLNPQLMTFPDGEVLTQTCGQLMGQLLSFPILCIVNYAAYNMRPSAEGRFVKINGDDILFSRRWRRDIEVWFDDVCALGMVASRGKTYVHRDVCTMNSEVFRRSDGRLRRVPFIHSGYLRITDGAACHLHHFVRSFSHRTTRLARMFIEHHQLEQSGLPVFGHEKLGGQGGILTPEIKLARVLSEEALKKQCLFARYSHGGNPIRCARNGDRLFRQFVKFEKNVAAVDRERLCADRAKLEVLRSWASPYDLSEPKRDFSNYGVTKSVVDTLLWRGDGSNKEANRPFMPKGGLPTISEAVAELKGFADRDPPVDGISLTEEFRQLLEQAQPGVQQA